MHSEFRLYHPASLIIFVFPASEELCDGKDNNCDTLIGGEGDFDGDGFLDCDDCLSDDPDSYPGAPEDGCDGIDHNCDGDAPPSESCDDDEDPKAGCGCASTPSGLGFAPFLAMVILVRRQRSRA